MNCPSVSALAVDESAEVVRVSQKWGRPLVRLTQPLSLRCTFCTFLHGVPLSSGNVSKRAPEDIAIRIAQAVACLQAQWYGIAPCVRPGLVLECGARWSQTLAALGESALGESSSMYSLRSLLPDGLPDECCILPTHARLAAECAFVNQLRRIGRDLDGRMAAALEPERLQRASDENAHIVRIDANTQLTLKFTRDLLAKHRYSSPIFCLADSGAKAPRLTVGATKDCKCQQPWNERPPWERYPHVQYTLPSATNLWRSCWLDSEGEASWCLPQLADQRALADELIGLAKHGLEYDLQDYCETMHALLGGCREASAPQDVNFLPAASNNTIDVRTESAEVHLPASGGNCDLVKWNDEHEDSEASVSERSDIDSSVSEDSASESAQGDDSALQLCSESEAEGSQSSELTQDDPWSGLVTPTHLTSGDAPVCETPDKGPAPSFRKTLAVSDHARQLIRSDDECGGMSDKEEDSSLDGIGYTNESECY